MTPYGATVARELRSALVPLETVSIVDHKYLPAAFRALLKNALFWVVPTAPVEGARADAVAAACCGASTCERFGICSAAHGWQAPAQKSPANKIAEPLSRFSGSASDALDAGQSAIKSGSEQLVRQAAKQPLEALLLAGAIGYLVGWAVNRS